MSQVVLIKAEDNENNLFCLVRSAYLFIWRKGWATYSRV